MSDPNFESVYSGEDYSDQDEEEIKRASSDRIYFSTVKPRLKDLKTRKKILVKRILKKEGIKKKRIRETCKSCRQ